MLGDQQSSSNAVLHFLTVVPASTSEIGCEELHLRKLLRYAVDGIEIVAACTVKAIFQTVSVFLASWLHAPSINAAMTSLRGLGTGLSL